MEIDDFCCCCCCWIGSYIYQVDQPLPSVGWRGFLLEFWYPGPIPETFYRLTTQVSITPNTFPFPPCQTQPSGCYGVLVWNPWMEFTRGWFVLNQQLLFSYLLHYVHLSFCFVSPTLCCARFISSWLPDRDSRMTNSFSSNLWHKSAHTNKNRHNTKLFIALARIWWVPSYTKASNTSK